MKSAPLLFALITGLAACGSETPTATGTICPSPDPMSLTYDNFGAQFMETYCTMCHAASIPRAQRNGAPLFHDFDTLLGVLQVHEHVDEQAGFGPDAENTFMPPKRCPSEPGGVANTDCKQPTDAERKELAEWIACEANREHSF